MKNSVSILMVLIIVFSCSHKPKTSYKEEALLNKYLKKYQSDKIIHKDYSLITYRTLGLCQACTRISLDTILSQEFKNKGNVELYVLFDKKEDLVKTKARYGNTLHYLIGNPYIMEQYGIPRVVPAMFYFKNSKLINWKQIDRY
ncbi:MAG: hypothetical protein RBS13_06065 [Bacteroidales bacterium]|jgi:hypothetical protein|nr:hypothetical protein [Bacteroidales bacterium]MDY0015758.1 hypothetical protein [Bacteroidales bacterium]